MCFKRRGRMFNGSAKIGKSVFRGRLRRFRTTTSEADIWF